MNFNDIRKNEDKGFSLVELIVVIAIMAVMVAVLAPSLLSYVERSRMQKDDSAMAEVANAVMLALSDQDIYDEVLYYSAKNNVSCYIDQAQETTVAAMKENTKEGGTEYWFTNDARRADEVSYRAAGLMRGMTITFSPAAGTNKTKYVLSEAAINKFIQGETGAKDATIVATDNTAAPLYINGAPDADGTPACGYTLGTMCTKGDGANHYLYNRVRGIIGDYVELSSQTYRNSNYTIFVRMGSTGGNQASAQDAVKVYGQWSGTNLALGGSPVPTEAAHG